MNFLDALVYDNKEIKIKDLDSYIQEALQNVNEANLSKEELEVHLEKSLIESLRR
jgi:hypothetical protein